MKLKFIMPQEQKHDEEKHHFHQTENLSPFKVDKFGIEGTK